MNNNSWLDKLEAKHPNWALDGLMRYIALLMIVIFILNKTQTLSYEWLYLNSESIKNWEIWRLFTFMIIPISNSPFLLFFELMIIVMCADGIEGALGSFKLTVYYLSGALFLIIAAFLSPGANIDSYYLYISLFFGYATLFPDEEMLFMFIIPIKIKYLAIASGIIILLTILSVPFFQKISIILSITNYLLFFAIPALKGIKHEFKQKRRKQDFEKAAQPANKGYRHKCATCGRTDVTNPELIFRYCTCKECGENGVAFCQEHLKNHKEHLQEH